MATPGSPAFQLAAVDVIPKSPEGPAAQGLAEESVATLRNCPRGKSETTPRSAPGTSATISSPFSPASTSDGNDPPVKTPA